MERPPLRVDAAGERLRLLHVHAHPDDESSKGAATHGQVRRRGRRGDGGHLHRRRARLHPQPGDGPTRHPGQHRRDPTGRRWIGPAPSSASSRSGSVSSTPACPRATRCRRCPTAASPRSTLEVAVGRLVEVIRQLPSARDDHVRRERRLPAPRPHPLPRDQRRGIRRGRRSRRATPTRGSRGRSRSSTTTFASTGGRFAALNHAMIEAAAWSRRTRSGWRTWERKPEARGAAHHPGRVRGLLRRYATRRCSRTRRRSIRRARGSRSRWRSTKRAWPTEDFELVRSTVDSEPPEDDLFAGIAVPAGGNVESAASRVPS